MRLCVGDVLYRKERIKSDERKFVVEYIRCSPSDDVYIVNRDFGLDVCWYGQIGENQSWTEYFITESDFFKFKRNEKIKIILKRD